MLVNYNNNNTTNKKNSIEYEKQKMYLKSFIRQAFNHPYVHMLNHTDKVNDNHIKMQKNCISLSDKSIALFRFVVMQYNAMKARESVVSIEKNKKKLNKSDLSVEASFEMYLIKFVDNYKIDGAL